MRKNSHAPTHDEIYTPRHVADYVVDRLKHDLAGKRIICPCDSPKSAFVFCLLDRAKELQWRRFAHYWRNGDGSGNFVEYEQRDGEINAVGRGRLGEYSWTDAGSLDRYASEYDVLITNPPFSMVVRALQELNQRISFCVLCFSGVLISKRTVGLKKFYVGGKSNIKYVLPRGGTFGVASGCITNMDPRDAWSFRPTKRLNEVRHTLWHNGVRVYSAKDVPIDYLGKIYAPFNVAAMLDPAQWEVLPCDDKRLYNVIVKRKIERKGAGKMSILPT